MKRVIAAVLVLSMFSIGNVGCAEKSATQNEIKVTTPGGTTVTIEKDVTKTGENPPPVKR